MKETYRARLAALCSFSLAVAACDAGPPDRHAGENLGEAESALKVCPGASTVRGIDVSVWQETIDWNQVHASGVEFGIARVSYGTGTIDQTFQPNWDGMKAAGMIRGAYQWVRPGQDIKAQADIVIAAVGKLGPGDLPAMADIEEAGSLSKAAYAANVQKWLDLVEAGTGKKPMIYTGSYFWDANVGSSSFQDYPLIDAAYIGACYSTTTGFVAADDCWKPYCPTISNAFDDWQFWQYTSQTHVPGISKYDYVDMDLFNGDMDALALLAGNAYAAELVGVDAPATAGPGETVTAHITYKNIGVSAWDTNTMLGTTGPRDRPSALAAPSWIAPDRATHVMGAVAPGDMVTLDVDLALPTTLGTYTEGFGLVEENLVWFADQGGPADDAVTIKIDVVSSPGTGATTSTSTGTSGGTGGAGGADNGATGDLHGSCNCSLWASPDDRGSRGAPAAALLGLAMIALRRRSRR